jgi:ketosteroid isomerase-like protein
VDAASFQRWLDAYVHAWKNYDEDAIGELFSEDARYRYHPWDVAPDEVEGRAAIVASWLEDRDQPDSWTAEYQAWAVDGDRAVAVGVSRYLAADRKTAEREYHNVFLCRFDAEGRCREFTEIFLRRPD